MIFISIKIILKFQMLSMIRLKKKLLNWRRNTIFKKIGLSKRYCWRSSNQPNLKKIKHLKPMLSLSNAFDKDDIVDFIKKINNFLNINKKILNFSQNQN